MCFECRATILHEIFLACLGLRIYLFELHPQRVVELAKLDSSFSKNRPESSKSEFFSLDILRNMFVGHQVFKKSTYLVTGMLIRGRILLTSPEENFLDFFGCRFGK